MTTTPQTPAPQPQGEYPPLPGRAFSIDAGSGGSVAGYSAEQMRAYGDAAIAAHSTKVLEGVEPVGKLSRMGSYQGVVSIGILVTQGHAHKIGDPVYSAATVAALQARVAELEKDANPEGFTQVVDAAAKMIDKMADDYSNAHAIQDHDTGIYEFGRGGKEDYYNTLRELADDVRSIVYSPEERAKQGGCDARS